MCEGALQPREAEALAFREALSWLKANYWDGIIVETDVKLLISSLKKLNVSPFGLILDDIKSLLSCFYDILFCHVCRIVNT